MFDTITNLSRVEKNNIKSLQLSRNIRVLEAIRIQYMDKIRSEGHLPLKPSTPARNYPAQLLQYNWPKRLTSAREMRFDISRRFKNKEKISPGIFLTFYSQQFVYSLQIAVRKIRFDKSDLRESQPSTLYTYNNIAIQKPYGWKKKLAPSMECTWKDLG